MTDLQSILSAPQQTLTDGQCSVTIESALSVQQTRDKSWIVQAGPNTRIVTHSGWAALNIPGDQTADVHGQTISQRPVRPGDSLVVLSPSAGGNLRTPVRYAPTGSVIDEAMVVVFVPYPVGPGMLRPPAIGRADNPIVRFLRTAGPIPEALMDLSRLPSVIDLNTLPVDWNAWGSYRPTMANTLALLGDGRFCGDLYSDWRAADRVPWTQHQGYGTFYGAARSTAGLMLCSTETGKEALAMALVQEGLDHVGQVADGWRQPPNGGHSWGRKFATILCGRLLNLPALGEPIMDLSKLFGNPFPEDWFAVRRWWTGDDLPCWPWNATYDGRHFQWPPSSWGDPEAPSHGTFAWGIRYMGQVVPMLLGQAVACKLLGIADKLNPALVAMCDLYMRGFPAQALSDLTATGINNLHFGEDYGVPWGFAVEAWRRYGQ